MPHVNIKFFPVPLDSAGEAELLAAVTKAVKKAFRVDEGAISIGLEPVREQEWHERVYVPEIIQRRELLRKIPNY